MKKTTVLPFLTAMLLFVPSQLPAMWIHTSVDNILWFSHDALSQLGASRPGYGVCIRSGPRFQLSPRNRIGLFGEIQYMDYGDMDGEYIAVHRLYRVSPWIFCFGGGVSYQRQLHQFLFVGLEASGGRMSYSAPIHFNYFLKYQRPGQEPVRETSAAFSGDGYYAQAGGGVVFRLWRNDSSGSTPAELLLKFYYNYCRGSDISCIRMESFVPLKSGDANIEEERTPLEHTQLRTGLEFGF